MTQPISAFEKVGKKREGSRRGGKKQLYVLGDRERRILLEKYDGKTKTITELSALLGVPRWKVKKWGCQLGLSRSINSREWTPEEIDYLHQYLHRKSMRDIAKYLNRTQTSVQLKAKRLGLSKSAEGYTMQALCIGLGCDHHKVEQWLTNGWIKANGTTGRGYVVFLRCGYSCVCFCSSAGDRSTSC